MKRLLWKCLLLNGASFVWASTYLQNPKVETVKINYPPLPVVTLITVVTESEPKSCFIKYFSIAIQIRTNFSQFKLL